MSRCSSSAARLRNVARARCATSSYVQTQTAECFGAATFVDVYLRTPSLPRGRRMFLHLNSEHAALARDGR